MTRFRPVKRLATPDGTSPGFRVVEVSWWRAPFLHWIKSATLAEAVRTANVLERARRITNAGSQ